MDIFLQQMVNGLVLGSKYALVALGYGIVFGIAFQLVGELVAGAVQLDRMAAAADRSPVRGRGLLDPELHDRVGGLPAAAQRAAPRAADHRHGHEPAAAD